MIGEFEIISRYFAPLAAAEPGAFGLEDDAAVLTVPAGRRLVVTTDTMVAGVHFLAADPPALVAAKLVRVNLSDLAAMGARPFAYTLNAAFPRDLGEEWIAAFAGGLGEDQRAFAVTLVGGDTVATPGPLTLTLTALGTAAADRVLLRSGARAGDIIYVSGTIGDATLGLGILKGARGGLSPALADELVERYRRPSPRVTLGERLVGIAHAAIDVSDGLVADLGHICETSGASALIRADAVPLSPGGRAALAADAARLTEMLSGGDDYELVFTAPAGSEDEVDRAARDAAVAVTAIGRIEAGNQGRVRVIGADGREIAFRRPGYRHF